jgi:type IV pilus assembly protein PilQ
MMELHKRHKLFVVFFWTIGSVCTAPVIGAEGAAPDSNAGSDSQPWQEAAAQMPQAAPATQPGQSNAGNASAAPAQPNQPDSSAGAATPPQGEPVAQGGEAPDLPKGQGVDVSSFGKIDLHVKDLKLTKVLQLLSIQAKKNIIASKKVSGAVSADLYNVDFYEALDAILHPNGYGYRKQGNFIYVYTAEELRKIQKQNREKVHQIIELNYINAADASGFVQPLLSSDGSISVSSQVEEGFKPSLSDGGANSLANIDKLVVYDYKSNVEEIQDVIDKLDKRPKQVRIEATILKAKMVEQNAFGVDFSLFTNSVDQLSSPLSVVDDLVQGSVGSGSGGNTNNRSVFPNDANPSISVGTVGTDGAAFVEALDSVTDVNVLASPELLVLNRQKADLLIGRKLGYLSTTQTSTAKTQTVEFLEGGTNLTVRPFISNDGFVRMELQPSLSDPDTSRTVGGGDGGGGTVIPEETTQELTTNVLVESGQTVVLGGLFKEDNSVSRRQVPGLGEVPGLGAAFQGQSDDVTRDEVIFLIKPTIMQQDTLAKAGDKMARDIQDSRLGARQGLLPWSRTKLTSSHMKQAMQHNRRGEVDKALWDVNLALYLDPTMVDAIQLKEKLTGEKMQFHDRSRLDNVVDAMVEQQIKEMEAEQDSGNAEEDGADGAEGADTADQDPEKAEASDKDAGGGDEASADAESGEPESRISVPADSGLAKPSGSAPTSDSGGAPRNNQDGPPVSIEGAGFRGGPPGGDSPEQSDEAESPDSE